ncbi:MAG: adenosylmethionine--8-amino-7-oxononanoate transaminase [Gemmatimonadota bacterium]|nr:adenosylmethionine--8-amino-7-oxononanoate transaminase [Gemmatimonadota bacterium]
MAERTSHVWSPFTQMKASLPVQQVRAGRGAVLELEDGRQILDCISSWWVTLHGHGQPEIAAAVAEQAKELEQVIAAGFTHRPAEELARRLVDALPAPLKWVFYSDDGSTAVEVALKLAYQFWHNQGERDRTRFLRFEGAYHGDTLGAMSVGERSLFTRPFTDLLFPTDAVPFPATWEGDGEVEAKEAQALARLEELLTRHPGQYAAMILEPLVQGAGGMRMCRPHFLGAVQTLLRQCDVLAIYDEVLTGFGRTGALFACEKAATQPDLICLAKGLTGGFLPMAATVCSERVFSAFYDDDPAKAFYHGHSYTANPLGCAAALASLDLLASEPFRRLASWQREEVVRLCDHQRLKQVRVCGTIVAADVIAEGEEGYLHEVGPLLREQFLARGFLLRPLGNSVYVLPPYCIERPQLASIYDCFCELIDAL